MEVVQRVQGQPGARSAAIVLNRKRARESAAREQFERQKDLLERFVDHYRQGHRTSPCDIRETATGAFTDAEVEELVDWLGIGRHASLPEELKAPARAAQLAMREHERSVQDAAIKKMHGTGSRLFCLDSLFWRLQDGWDRGDKRRIRGALSRVTQNDEVAVVITDAAQDDDLALVRIPAVGAHNSPLGEDPASRITLSAGAELSVEHGVVRLAPQQGFTVDIGDRALCLVWTPPTMSVSSLDHPREPPVVERIL